MNSNRPVRTQPNIEIHIQHNINHLQATMAFKSDTKVTTYVVCQNKSENGPNDTFRVPFYIQYKRDIHLVHSATIYQDIFQKSHIPVRKTKGTG